VGLGSDIAKTRVIPPAVDLEMFHPISEGEMRQTPLKLTAIGPLDWTMNFEQTLRSLRRALDLGVDARLELIGDGPDLPHLRFSIDDLDLRDRVEFAGQQPPEAVARRLRQADVFLASGAPGASVEPVLQAMASGLPVVASRIGVASELVHDGIDGVLVQPRDAASTAAAIARLATDVRSRVRMGAAGRRRACAEFSSRQHAMALSALFHEAVIG